MSNETKNTNINILDELNQEERELYEQKILELEQFRKSDRLKKIKFNNREIDYYSSGKGTEAVLLFHGAAQKAEFAYGRILQLETHTKVIAPNLVYYANHQELIDAINKILDLEEVKSLHLLGGSFGGAMAQTFFYYNFPRVKNLILSYTIPPLPDQANSYKRALKILKLFPQFLLKRYAKKLLSNYTDLPEYIDAYLKTEILILKDLYFQMLKNEITKTHIINQLALSTEFNYKIDNSLEEQQAWDGHVLIFTSNDDPGYKYHDKLLEQFPKAEVILYENTGHWGSLLKEKDYMEKILNLIK